MLLTGLVHPFLSSFSDSSNNIPVNRLGHINRRLASRNSTEIIRSAWADRDGLLRKDDTHKSTRAHRFNDNHAFGIAEQRAREREGFGNIIVAVAFLSEVAFLSNLSAFPFPSGAAVQVLLPLPASSPPRALATHGWRIRSQEPHNHLGAQLHLLGELLALRRCQSALVFLTGTPEANAHRHEESSGDMTRKVGRVTAKLSLNAASSQGTSSIPSVCFVALAPVSKHPCARGRSKTKEAASAAPKKQAPVTVNKVCPKCSRCEKCTSPLGTCDADTEASDDSWVPPSSVKSGGERSAAVDWA